MNQPGIDAIRERHAKATEGPWFFNSYSAVISEPRSREHIDLERAHKHMETDDVPFDEYPETCVASVPCVAGDTATSQGRLDAEFIAHSWSDVAALLAMVDELRESQLDFARRGSAAAAEAVALLARAEKAEAGETHALDELRAVVGAANDELGPDEEEFARGDALEAARALRASFEKAEARVAELERVHREADAVRRERNATAASVLGGQVEGRPTGPHNWIQRARALVELESQAAPLARLRELWNSIDGSSVEPWDEDPEADGYADDRYTVGLALPDRERAEEFHMLLLALFSPIDVAEGEER